MKNGLLLGIKKKRFLIQLFWHFLFFLIPIILIAALTLNNSINNSEYQFKQRISQNLESVVTTVDSYIEASQTIGLNFFSDDTVVRMFMPQNSQIPSVAAEQWRIPKIIGRNENLVSNYIDSIFAYFSEDEYVYTGSGTVDKELFYNNIYYQEQYGQEFWDKAPHSSKSLMILSPFSILDKSKNIKKDILPVVTIGRANTFQAAVVVNISLENIKSILKGVSIIDSTEYIVTDSKNNAILNTSEIDSKILNDLKLNEGAVDKAEKINIKGKKYMITNVNSSFFGWNYYAFVPLVELNRSTYELAKVTLFICALLVILSVFVAYRFSLSIYRPIRSILDTLIDNNQDTFEDKRQDSNKSDELKELKFGIERLSVNHKRYKQQYYKYSNEYVAHSFQLLRNGMVPTQIGELEKILQAEYGFEKPNYLCCNVLFSFHPKFYKEILDTDRILFTNQLARVLEILFSEAFPCCVMEMQNNTCTCIINCNTTEEFTGAEELLSQITLAFCSDSDYYKVIIGVGEMFQDLNEFHMSYNTAMTAIQNRNDDSLIQRLDIDNTSVGNSVIYTLYDQQKLINCVKSGNPENLNAAISDILYTNIKMGMTFDNAKILYQQLVTTGIQYFTEKGESIDTLEFCDTVKAILDKQDVFTSVENSKKFFVEFYNEIMFLCSSVAAQKSADLVDRIKNYVDEQYTRDLCLERIADDLMVSAKYVSRIFKDKMGINLTDYICDVRVNKAKELLKTTNMKISEISSQIGIESRTTFLRVFKKRTGVSPNEYRNL
jgi:two-component system response regulator YesN